jgi:hypothetical protein
VTQSSASCTLAHLLTLRAATGHKRDAALPNKGRRRRDGRGEHARASSTTPGADSRRLQLYTKLSFQSRSCSRETIGNLVLRVVVPSPFLFGGLRAVLFFAAVRCARSVSYSSCFSPHLYMVRLIAVVLPSGRLIGAKCSLLYHAEHPVLYDAGLTPEHERTTRPCSGIVLTHVC